MLPGVDQPRTVRVTLEFEQGSDPPRGRLLHGQAVYPFAGWLGLAAALEHVIGADTLTRPGLRAPTDGQASLIPRWLRGANTVARGHDTPQDIEQSVR